MEKSKHLHISFAYLFDKPKDIHENSIFILNKVKTGIKLNRTVFASLNGNTSGTSEHMSFPSCKKETEIKKPRILSIGRLERSKGIYRVLNVFFRLIKLYPESVLNIVGSGTEKSNIEKIS